MISGCSGICPIVTYEFLLFFSDTRKDPGLLESFCARSITSMTTRGLTSACQDLQTFGTLALRAIPTETSELIETNRK